MVYLTKNIEPTIQFKIHKTVVTAVIDSKIRVINEKFCKNLFRKTEYPLYSSVRTLDYLNFLL